MRGGVELEFSGRVHVNDRVTVKGTIVDIKEKEGKSGTLVFVTSEFVYTNQNGELLCILRASQIRR